MRVASYTNQRAIDKIKRGQLPGPEMSIAKLSLTNNMKQLAEFVANVLGAKIIADSGEWGTYAWSQFVLGVPGMRIAGGTDEVMRNIVGERVLGLPKDAGIDTTTPFRDLKVGTQKPGGLAPRPAPRRPLAAARLSRPRRACRPRSGGPARSAVPCCQTPR